MRKKCWVFKCDRCGRVELDHWHDPVYGQHVRPQGWSTIEEQCFGYGGKHLCGSCQQAWARFEEFMQSEDVAGEEA